MWLPAHKKHLDYIIILEPYLRFTQNEGLPRSPRKDNEYFYATHKFYSFEDFKTQLAVHLRNYNNFPMRPLNWISPKATLFNFLNFGVTYH